VYPGPAPANWAHHVKTSVFNTVLLLQPYRPLQQIMWPCRPIGEAPPPFWAPPSVTVSYIFWPKYCENILTIKLKYDQQTDFCSAFCDTSTFQSGHATMRVRTHTHTHTLLPLPSCTKLLSETRVYTLSGRRHVSDTLLQEGGRDSWKPPVSSANYTHTHTQTVFVHPAFLSGVTSASVRSWVRVLRLTGQK